MRDDDEEPFISKWAWITIIVAIVCFTILVAVTVVVDSNSSDTRIEFKLW